jgi:hypothetical protein
MGIRVALIVAVITLGSGSPTSYGDDLGNRIHVITQICVPNDKGESKEVVWLDPVTQTGYGGRATRISGVTTGNQPVFELYAGPPREIVGVVVFLASARDTKLIFAPPRSLPTDSWTPWEVARFSSTSDRVQGALLRGVDIPDKSLPAHDAPRMRYRLMRFNEYLARVGKRRESGIETNLPSC